MAKNPLGKSRTADKPYAIFRGHQIEWRVLKTYKLANNEDQYSRWFVHAISPYTSERGELGDAYRDEILLHGRLCYASDEFDEAYPPELFDQIMRNIERRYHGE